MDGGGEGGVGRRVIAGLEGSAVLMLGRRVGGGASSKSWNLRPLLNFAGGGGVAVGGCLDIVGELGGDNC